MKKNSLFTFLLFLTLTTVMAQKEHKITLNPTNSQLTERKFFIKEVVDVRANKETIGYAQKGLSNRIVNANFSEPFTEYLQKVFDKMIPARRGLTPIIAKVHNLYVSETATAWKETGMATIAIEFISEDGTMSRGLYQATEQRKGADVTKKHDERILAALTSCLTQLMSRWGTNLTPVVDLAITKFDPQQPINKGIYLSFSDFMLNKPITTIDFLVEEVAKKTPLYKIRDKKTDKKLKNVYGVFDGQDFYLNASQYSYATHYTKAQFKGRFIYFEDKVSNTGSTIAFGLIGALASTKTMGLVLDTQTGLISELTRDYLAIILKDYPELRQMYNDSNKELPIKRVIVKKLNGILAAEE